MERAFEFLPEENIIQQRRNVKVKDIGKGTLYLTNMRMNFEKISGLFRKKSEFLTLLYLDDVTYVGSRGNRLIVETSESRYEFSIKESEHWERAVEAAVRDRLTMKKVTEAEEVSKEFCPQCGAQLLTGDVYCPKCGRKVRFD
ncbi:MAG: zinc ribbon domain-containing protein [Candidatus Bathyarchaeia archaeon]